MVERVEEDTIADLEMDSIEVYGDGSFSKDGHRLALRAILKIGSTLMPPSYQS